MSPRRPTEKWAAILPGWRHAHAAAQPLGVWEHAVLGALDLHLASRQRLHDDFRLVQLARSAGSRQATDTGAAAHAGRALKALAEADAIHYQPTRARSTGCYVALLDWDDIDALGDPHGVLDDLATSMHLGRDACVPRHRSSRATTRDEMAGDHGSSRASTRDEATAGKRSSRATTRDKARSAGTSSRVNEPSSRATTRDETTSSRVNGVSSRVHTRAPEGFPEGEARGENLRGADSARSAGADAPPTTEAAGTGAEGAGDPDWIDELIDSLAKLDPHDRHRPCRELIVATVARVFPDGAVIVALDEMGAAQPASVHLAMRPIRHAAELVGVDMPKLTLCQETRP